MTMSLPSAVTGHMAHVPGDTLCHRIDEVGPHTAIAGLIGEAMRRAQVSSSHCATLASVLARLQAQSWPWDIYALYELFVNT